MRQARLRALALVVFAAGVVFGGVGLLARWTPVSGRFQAGPAAPRLQAALPAARSKVVTTWQTRAILNAHAGAVCHFGEVCSEYEEARIATSAVLAMDSCKKKGWEKWFLTASMFQVRLKHIERYFTVQATKKEMPDPAFSEHRRKDVAVGFARSTKGGPMARLLIPLLAVIVLVVPQFASGVSLPRPKQRSEPVPLSQAGLPVGKWKAQFANGVIEACEIRKDGKASVVEPRRNSGGKTTVKRVSAVITFDDDRIERWTRVGKRFVVEHWFPGSQFPIGTPVLGIAERVN